MERHYSIIFILIFLLFPAIAHGGWFDLNFKQIQKDRPKYTGYIIPDFFTFGQELKKWIKTEPVQDLVYRKDTFTKLHKTGVMFSIPINKSVNVIFQIKSLDWNVYQEDRGRSSGVDFILGIQFKW